MRRPLTTKEKLEAYDLSRQELETKQARTLPWLFTLPIFVFTILAMFSQQTPVILGSTALAIVMSFAYHYFSIGTSFNELKEKVRKALVDEFMDIFHPNTSYRYYPGKKSVRDIVKKSGLISGVNRYREEDVIIGKHKGAHFYFSEIHLLKKSKKSTSTKFRGILFRLQIPHKSFPKSKIQSRLGLLNMLMGNSTHNKKYDVHISSEDLDQLEQDLEPLLPFISHLSKEQGDIRIKTHGDEIIIMMDSDMKFLDEPAQGVSKSFLKNEYKKNIARQMNTLLFIVDAFINNADTSEIEERFELKSLIKLREQA